MIVYWRAEAEWRWMRWEILILRRPELGLDLKLELLTQTVDGVLTVGDIVRL